MSTTLDAFQQALQFPLDDFQLEAMSHIDENRSVVVCAPTGSGKTIIAEFAINKAFELREKLFYTTPLKALSNQKFFDFKKEYGEDRVGLLTGDLSVNRDAQIVVMTTEVFRNMLYGVSEDSNLLGDVGFVVLDECHYMNDASRGTVWEESIIYCPPNIRIIALSATVANARELTAWINQVHGETRLVQSSFRPVPLRFSYYTRERIVPLFEPGTGQDGRRGKLNKVLKTDRAGNRFAKNLRKLDYNQLIMEMHERDMLPAIFFIFSRKGCDQALKDTRDLDLLTRAERDNLRTEINMFIEQYPMLADNESLYDLGNGFACHHAGLLPALKLLVEQLFQQGLIKVVFATETLAAGINMPARSTVITAISKRTDDGHRILTASEFLQMSGRAGRRGMDPVGYVIVVSNQHQSAGEAAHLASSGADALNSQFTPTFGMVLNLLQTHSLDEAQYLLTKSFGQFTIERRLSPLAREIADREEALAKVQATLCKCDVSEKDFEIFMNTQERLYALNQQIGTYRKQIKKYGPLPELVEEANRMNHRRDTITKSLEESPCKACPDIKRHMAAESKKEKLEKRIDYLRKDYELEKNLNWRNFYNIYQLLKFVEYIDENDRPTGMGLLTAKIRTENEFFLARLIEREVINDVSPQTLAAVLCAIVLDSNRDNVYCRPRWSAETEAVYPLLIKEIKKVKHLQEKFQVGATLNLNPVACGLIEAWADGMPWPELIRNTNMGEGDLVRIIRRTSDLLRQISRIPEIPKKLATTAKIALHMVYRDPIQEVDFVEVTKDNEDHIVEVKAIRLEREAEHEPDSQGEPVTPASTPSSEQ